MIQRALWRLIPGVRRDERSRFALFLLLFLLLTVADTLGLVAAESLFLANVGVSALPVALVMASLVATLGSVAYAGVVDPFRNDRLLVVMLLLAAGILVPVGAAVALGQGWAFLALFCVYWLYRSVFLLHYGTFARDYFDSLSSKRLLPRLFATGSSVGGVVGGLLAAGVARMGAAEWLVAAWALLLVITAALLLGNSRRLLRWIPLEAMEADDTSVERLRGAGRYLRQTPLGRWLFFSSLAMTVAFFVAQYAYLAIFERTFPDANGLALFIGVFLALANVLELAVGEWVSRWLIPRIGVPSANLLHPCLTFASFLGLAASPQIPMAVAARLNRESLENALAAPVRNLSHNALPDRYRGRVRGFLEIAANSGMGGAGLLLLLLGSGAELGWVCGLGAVAALAYGFANLRVRREYVRGFMVELRAGRLDLREIEREIGSGEAAPLAEFFGSLLESEEVPPARLLGQIAGVLARHGFSPRLLAALAHPRASVRRVALDALLGVEAPERLPALVRALEDTEPEIRLAALRAAQELAHPLDERLLAPLRGCLDHPDPRLRAMAAATLGDEGWPALADLLACNEPSVVAAALGALPEDRLALARDQVAAANPWVRAAALTRLGRSSGGLGEFRAHVVTNLEHSEVSVRRAALAALARHPDPADASALLARIRDPSREVRILAGRSLAGLGEAGIEHARHLLRSDSRGEVEAALGLLVALGTPDALLVLAAEFRGRLRLAWRALFAMEVLTDSDLLPARFLHLSLRDAFGRHVRVAFAILERTERPGVVRTLEKTLRFASSRVRADALEVLSLLGDREGARLLVPLLEAGPLEERSALARSLVGAPRDQGEVLLLAPRFGRFARAAAAALGSGDDAPEVPMERMLLLSRVPLFSQLTLEQLEAIDALMSEVHYMSGEVITREGDTGDELFVVLEGEVSIYKETADDHRLHLSTMRPGSYLGEMAILSDEPRSATAIAACPSRLLSLRGDPLKELILDMPEIAFELMRVLTGRVRTVERRLAEGGSGETSGSPSPPSPESREGDGS